MALIFIVSASVGAAEPEFTRQEDVTYGRKDGMALTLDVFRPTGRLNGVGIIWVCSGGWFSSHDYLGTKPMLAAIAPELSHGYTVFAVVHSSQPRFTIPDAVLDINRAVRFVRYHAQDFRIDPKRLGITGGSAGGHLSLMQGVKPMPPDPKSADPVDRVSARVQAVGCFFPPTDFLNYGGPGNLAWKTSLKWLLPPFDFLKQNKKGEFVRLTGMAKREVAREVSPIYWISPAAPPTLIIHGDADGIVPIEQSKRFIEKLKAAHVPARLVVRHGMNHGWANMRPGEDLICKWFDHYLLHSPSTHPEKQKQTP